MDDIVYERDYTVKDEQDSFSSAVFEQAFAPGGFMEEFTKKMNAIPKVIVPEDKENYEYLLIQCDSFAQRHQGSIRGVVDYKHWDAHIELSLPLLEFGDETDMALLKDIGERAHYVSVSNEDGCFHVYILINYFQELMSEEYGEYLKFETLMQDERLSELLAMPQLSAEDEAIAQIIGDTLDRFDRETSVDRTTAFRAVVDYLMRDDSTEISVERIAALLTALLEKVIEEEQSEMEE